MAWLTLTRLSKKYCIHIYERITKEEVHFHTFVHEIYWLISKFEDILEEDILSKIDKKRILLNLDYLEHNRTFKNLDAGAMIFGDFTYKA